ncbi:hypothetical protein L9F63_023329, partial [Diploptera punctata]
VRNYDHLKLSIFLFSVSIFYFMAQLPFWRLIHFTTKMFIYQILLLKREKIFFNRPTNLNS